MIKKILISLLIFGFSFTQNIYADSTNPNLGTGTEEPKICDTDPQNKINCSKFTIQTSIFTPGEGKILDKAKSGGGDTVKSANAILGTIIKNLIVVFGALSLLMMTIGGGMMIFHAGQESILTKGKGIFVWGVASLAIGLSAGLIVKLISYILY